MSKKNKNLLAQRLITNDEYSADNKSNDVDIPNYGEDINESDFETPQKRTKKKKIFGKSKEKVEYSVNDNYENYTEETAEELEENDAIKRHMAKVNEKRHNAMLKALQIVLAVASVYVSFLIYGVVVTNYNYNSTGQVAPEILSVDDLKDLSAYRTLESYYIRIQNLYKDVIRLDYDLSQNPENSLQIAMEYQKQLKVVDKLATDLAAEDIEGEYGLVYGQISNWTRTDIAVYLQNISTALANNDSRRADNALVARDVSIKDYTKITENMVSIAKNTKGIQLSEIYFWSPTDWNPEERA